MSGAAGGSRIKKEDLKVTIRDYRDNILKSLGLDKVVLLYIGVGFLFIAAAALFYFSKKVPTGIANEPRSMPIKQLME